MHVDALLRIVEEAYGKKFYEDSLGVAIDHAVREAHSTVLNKNDNDQIRYVMRTIAHIADELNRVQRNLQCKILFVTTSLSRENNKRD